MTKEDKEVERVAFQAFLPKDLHHRLKVAAVQRSVKMNDLICEGVERRLDEIDGLGGGK